MFYRIEQRRYGAVERRGWQVGGGGGGDAAQFSDVYTRLKRAKTTYCVASFMRRIVLSLFPKRDPRKTTTTRKETRHSVTKRLQVIGGIMKLRKLEK
jgi:hypothetical protein